MATEQASKNGWTIVHDIDNGGYTLECKDSNFDAQTKTITMNTDEKSLDGNVVVTVKARSASGLNMSILDKTNTITIGDAIAGGYYFSVTVSLTANITSETPGWFDSATLTDQSVIVGRIPTQSITLVNSQPSGNTLLSDVSMATTTRYISLLEGYNKNGYIKIKGSSVTASTGAYTSSYLATYTPGTSFISIKLSSGYTGDNGTYIRIDHCPETQCTHTDDGIPSDAGYGGYIQPTSNIVLRRNYVFVLCSDDRSIYVNDSSIASSCYGGSVVFYEGSSGWQLMKQKKDGGSHETISINSTSNTINLKISSGYGYLIKATNDW